MAEVIGMPKLGFDMAEGTLVRWVINEGEQVSKGQVLAEIETDKATVEVESEYQGTLLHQLVPQGTVAPVSEPIAVIGEAGEEVDLEALLGKTPEEEKPAAAGKKAEKESALAEEMPTTPLPAEKSQPAGKGGYPASPLARSMANELGINLSKVQGSGPGGRITKKDIQAYQSKAPEAQAARPTAVAPVSPAAPTQPFIRETRNVPLPKLRAAIGRRMSASMQQAPHFYVTHDYDVSALIKLRKEMNGLLTEDEKLSVNDFIVRGVALAILEFPNLNASLDQVNNSLIYHGEVNIGVAVAVQNGLLTVVSRNTDQKSVYKISSELKVLVNRARQGKVRSEDVDGSTFTVSNMGMYDIDQFTAIINPPEAAILAVGSAKQVPVVEDGEIKIGNRMKATLSIDHRISDGAEGARFLQALARYIEEPLRLLI
jgi:pyruvate dehydrogenase E2 component (dihydrolipoamide acetyltransferase)